jgi:hypothetical protein
MSCSRKNPSTTPVFDIYRNLYSDSAIVSEEMYMSFKRNLLGMVILNNEELVTPKQFQLMVSPLMGAMNRFASEPTIFKSNLDLFVKEMNDKYPGHSMRSARGGMKRNVRKTKKSRK